MSQIQIDKRLDMVKGDVIYTNSICEQVDKTKFEWLYDKYYRLMFWKAAQILSNTNDVEDAVHSSFLKIIKILNQIDLDDERKTKKLVLIITEHTCIDGLRKRRKRNEVPLSSIEEWQIPLAIESERVLIRNMGENRVLAAIEDMSEQYRDILVLKYYVGYENNQIAAFLEISEALVRKRISRGKKKLEGMLKERGIW